MGVIGVVLGHYLGVKMCVSNGTGVTFAGAATRKSKLGWYAGVGMHAPCIGRQWTGGYTGVAPYGASRRCCVRRWGIKNAG